MVSVGVAAAVVFTTEASNSTGGVAFGVLFGFHLLFFVSAKEEKIEQLTNKIHSLENIIKEKCIQKDHEEDKVTPKSEPPAQKVAQPRRMGRKAALLERMKRNAQSAPKSGKKSTPKTKRSALGDHNSNIEDARRPSLALASVCSM